MDHHWTRTLACTGLAASSGALTVHVMNFPARSRVYPALVFGVLTFTLAVRASVLAWEARWRDDDASTDDHGLAISRSEMGRIASFLTTWLGYSVLLGRTGFIIGTALALALSLSLLQERYSVWQILGAVAAGFALFVVFQGVFNIPLPKTGLERWVESYMYRYI